MFVTRAKCYEYFYDFASIEWILYREMCVSSFFFLLLLSRSSVFDRLNGCRRENPQTCFLNCVSFFCVCCSSLFINHLTANALNHCAWGAHNSFSISWFSCRGIWENLRFRNKKLFCWFTIKNRDNSCSIQIRFSLRQTLKKWRHKLCTPVRCVYTKHWYFKSYSTLSLFIDLGDIRFISLSQFQ